jgi:hypothetical protein
MRRDASTANDLWRSALDADAWKIALNALNHALHFPRVIMCATGHSEAKNFCGTQKASEEQRFWGIVQR